MKKCIDCKFYQASPFGAHLSKCVRPVGISNIDGKPRLHKWNYCSLQREDSRFSFFAWITGCCTRGARYFEPKQ